MANYKEISCSVACNKLKRKIPFAWDLNIYRGCEHGCKYCYAMYSHKYLDSEQYFEDIYVKTNIVEALEKQLRSSSWKREVVNIGGVTDSYQPIEKQYKLMPEILRLMIKYKTPCIISTKSDLVLRDYDLIAELANITYVNIAATITCMDENIRRKIEPNGAPSLKRFEILKAFSKTNASTGLHFMPIIPFLTDGFENIDCLYSHTSDCNVDYVLPGVLYLRGKTREVFFDFVKQEFPNLYEPLQTLYKKGGAGKEYKDKLYIMINELKDKYGLSSSYSKPMKEKMSKSSSKQLSFF
ncbi:SPL family radical SAM protein [Geosporobacter ferrireducens]|uniref:Radical SAM protein n=1 Tax=Geosporobacter ferrireducens TaxID=1424294 RepID=A0A1D8GDK8_9FIRM|nr:radical SAM protein [Geosporobacter ferrireducens]AOT68984.1 radical SAM protein [Geosporobacter ferrireducens]MTI54775.1 radical SAM protein [Geosporobacter ferrireducens]